MEQITLKLEKHPASRATVIRLTDAEKWYARVLSLRMGCTLDLGSVAFGLKALLRREAKAEGFKLYEE